jgi:hypothetical protein
LWYIAFLLLSFSSDKRAKGTMKKLRARISLNSFFFPYPTLFFALLQRTPCSPHGHGNYVVYPENPSVQNCRSEADFLSGFAVQKLSRAGYQG